MRSRRGAVSVGVAAFATALAHVAFVDGCGEFGVVDEAKDASAAPADAQPGDLEAAGEAATGDAAAAADAASPDAACGHYFCADFEQSQPTAGWADKATGVGGALAIAAGMGAPGNALRSTIPLSAAADWAYVIERFPAAMGIHIELEINVPDTILVADAVLTILQFSGPVAMVESGVGVVLRATTPSLGFYIAAGDGTAQTSNAQLDLPRGKWVHLALDVRFGSTGHLKLLVDGNTAWDKALETEVPPTPELRVGVQHYNGATPAVSALYDTVRVDLLP